MDHAEAPAVIRALAVNSVIAVAPTISGTQLLG